MKEKYLFTIIKHSFNADEDIFNIISDQEFESEEDAKKYFTNYLSKKLKLEKSICGMYKINKNTEYEKTFDIEINPISSLNEKDSIKKFISCYFD